MSRPTNRLAQESSPYLLQHAHNPVDWYPWGEEAFAKARSDNKLVLISIGYSSCHWCHVMERECFENEALAQEMNARYVCIKVDREERPDVDHIYMNAVQLMTRRGGWPLNCFTLPDGRPIYGGTYFPPDQWRQVLQDLDATWKGDPGKVAGYAARLHEGVQASDLVHPPDEPVDFDRNLARHISEALEHDFDRVFGGADRTPKFPLPNTYEYLLHHAVHTKDATVEQHVRLTLDKMEQGGLHDQVGGGFARYSVDARWKVPHFEKMLYDNAQLVQLYAKGYQVFSDEAYRRVVERTIGFLQRELMGSDGLFQSALDADSEGVEGLFYVWTRAEVDHLLDEEAALARSYFCMDDRGLWEHDRYILLRDGGDGAFASRMGISVEELRQLIDGITDKLLHARADRVRPGLDHKALTSWNAMMITALCHAADALEVPHHLQLAQRTMGALLQHCRRPDGGLWRTCVNGRAGINGFLEDHAFTIEALLTLYQADFDPRWIEEARILAEYTVTHFHDERTGLFWSTSDLDPALISRPMEVHDNVIPASNSTLAKALHTLGHLIEEQRWIDLAEGQLRAVLPQVMEHPASHTNWGLLLLDLVFPYPAIAIVGAEANTLRRTFGRTFIPSRLFLGTTGTSTLPLLAERPATDRTMIHVCEHRSCRMPVATVEEALQELS
ncbi:MAG TPA: thioredoxin domain-containing protein [Flavobacteriales bacterium]